MGREMIIQMCNRLPDYSAFYYARLGMFSLSTHAVKYIAFEDGVEYNGKVDTVSSHYRTSLDNQHIGFSRKNKDMPRVTYPAYCHPARLPMACYVDIRHAFRQIGRSFGYETYIREGKQCAYGDTLPDNQLLTLNKVARGLCVTGHGEKGSFTEWKNGDLKTVHFPNKYYAPHFVYAIWRTLHAIMSKLRPFVYYVHTDGVICNHRMLSRVCKILDDNGFDYSIKLTGQATIKAVGIYQIGDYQTGNYNRQAWASHDNIIEDHNNWWLNKFSFGKSLRHTI